MLRLFSTKHNAKWWKERKIDWAKDYLSTWNHPHRWFLAHKLRQFKWLSLFEYGVGAGANIMFLAQAFPNRQFGGIDIAPNAIKVCEETMPGGIFRVGDADPLVMSDKACDIMLTDMTLIYVDPLKIKGYLSEFCRVTRRHLVIHEFYHPSFWRRLQMTLAGRYTHNYPKLLRALDCHDIVIEKMPKELWPDAKDTDYRYIITCRI